MRVKMLLVFLLIVQGLEANEDFCIRALANVNIDRTYGFSAYHESHFYYSCDFGITIINVNDLENPRIVGTIPTPGDAKGIAIDNDRMYVADGRYGLLVFSLEGPDNPILISDNREHAGFDLIDAFEDHILATNRTQIYSGIISEHGEINFRDNYECYEAMQMQIADSILYFYKGRLRYLELSENGQLSNPNVVTTNGEDVFGRFIVEDTLIYASYGGDEFDYNHAVIDISNLEHPQILGGYHADSRLNTKSGNYLYHTYGDENFQIVDASDTRNPRVIGNIPRDSIRTANGVTAGDGVLSVRFQDGLKFLDTSNPAEPVIRGTIEKHRAENKMILNYDRYFYVLDVYDSRGHNDFNLYTYHLDRENTPVLVNNNFGEATHILFIHDNYLYGASNQYLIFSLEDPENPELVSTFLFDEGVAERFVFDGDLGFGAGWEGLVVFNISDPVNPEFIDFYTEPIHGHDWTVDVAVDDEWVYVLGGWQYNLIKIYARFGGGTLALWSRLEGIQGEYYDFDAFAVENDLAYLSDGSCIYTVALNDRRNLEIIHELHVFPARVSGKMVKRDDYLICSGWKDGIAVISIADPERPRLIGYYDTPGEVEDMDVNLDLGLIFVADLNNTGIYDFSEALSVDRASNPFIPKLVSFESVSS